MELFIIPSLSQFPPISSSSSSISHTGDPPEALQGFKWRPEAESQRLTTIYMRRVGRRQKRSSGLFPSAYSYHSTIEGFIPSAPTHPILTTSAADIALTRSHKVEGDSDRGKKFEKEGVNPNCANASNPYHKCAEYCFEKLQDQPAMKPKELKKAGLTTDRVVKSECKFASNPYHVCDKHCLESVPMRDQPEQTMQLKSSREVKKAPRKKERTTGSPPSCKHKSIPHHECTEICLQSVPSRDFSEREKPNGDSVKSEKRNAPLHRSASVPFHTVTEYCLDDTIEKEHPKRATTKAEEETKVSSSLPWMNSKSSNPYHNVEVCNDDVLERDQPGKTFMRPKVKETVDFPAERAVNPDCQFASNRYHVCDGYGFQNVPKREKPQKDMKLNGLKELKKLFSNKKITREQPECIFASNPYHKCAEYCLYGDMPNGAMKINEKKKDDNYSSRRGVDLNHKQASKKNEETEVTFKEKKRDSLKDGTKSAESKHVDVSNPVYDKFDLKDITEDLHSAKVVKIKQLKEPADVQLTDSSDILHEWTKYCSQKGADDIIGNIEGEVYLKDYASENLKVQANGRLACSISISLLYFLGFLFSAVYWIQMIHSFIMSSEKAKGGERMKAEGEGIMNAEMRPIQTTFVPTAASED